MNINIAQDWPVYILLGAVAFFFIYAIIKGRQQEKRNKEARATKENTPFKKAP